MNKKLCLIVFGLVLLVLSLAASSFAQPANDNFFNAEVIDPTSLPLTYIVNNTDATLQQDEPNYICQYSQKTVWYKITPTTDAVLLAKMEGSMIYDTVLRVFQQTGSDITSLAFPTYCWTYCEECSAAWAPATTWVIFSVSAGTTYYIQAGNSYSDGGELHLTVEVYPPPPNDNFADATVITGVPFTSDSLYLMAATEEIGEPILSCFSGPFGGTAWYTFTPSVTQYYVGNLMYPIWNWCFGVYTGSSLGNLSQLVSHDGNPVIFHATAGMTYYIQVYNGGQWVYPTQFTLEGSIQLSSISISPTSLNFAQVIVGGSSAKTVTVSNIGTGNLIIGTIDISGTNADQFRIPTANDHCSNQTVLPSSSCTVDVKFSPTLTGNMNATLNIPSNDPDTPTANFALTGKGAKIVVTSPNGGETLESGKVWMFMRWDTSPTINPVKDTYLYYSFDGGATWKLLAISVGNLGWYPWQVPHVTKTKSRCKVKVELKNAKGKTVGSDVSDKVFTIQP